MESSYNTFLEEEDAANKRNIKPCPFCGAKALVAYGLSDYAYFQVYCTNPNCKATSGSQYTAVDAIAHWEQRDTRRIKKPIIY